MKAGQQGPQLSARVFLNHDLVTDCACVLKGMCTFIGLPGDDALSVFGVDRRLLAEDGHISLTLADAILLLPSERIHLQASSVASGVPAYVTGHPLHCPPHLSTSPVPPLPYTGDSLRAAVHNSVTQEMSAQISYTSSGVMIVMTT